MVSYILIWPNFLKRLACLCQSWGGPHSYSIVQIEVNNNSLLLGYYQCWILDHRKKISYLLGGKTEKCDSSELTHYTYNK